MREEHPIDNQFREALFGAEVQPPASVWAGVKNRRRRRGMAFWSRRRGLTIVTLFVALGAGAYWALNADRERTSGAGQLATPVATEGSSAVPSPLVETPAPDPNLGKATITKPASTTEASNEPVQPITNEVPASRAPEMTRKDPVPSAPRKAATVSDRPMGEGLAATIVPSEEAPAITPAPPPLETGPIQRMNGLRTEWHATDHLLTPRTAIVPAYVLPNSEWWLGAQVGWYDVRRQWSGGGAELRDALNASEAWTSTIGMGLLAGRTWRSGWGFSVGAEHERSEQQFRHIERTVATDETIETMMVTLNAELIFLDVDTVVTQVVNEQVAEGIDRRSVLRIPLDGHWRGSWHRWMYGMGLGVAGEFTRTTSSSILVQDTDGRIVSAAPEGGELRDRYPMMLLGTVSADVGYLLSEHWSLWASPAYIRSLTAFNNGSDVFAEPERFGLRLRLSYTFNCSR